MNKNLHLMLLTLPVFIAVVSVAQSSEGAAQQLLSNGKDPMEALPKLAAERTEIIISPDGASRTISSCDCWVIRDRAWQVVPFTNSSPPDYRNDDGSSPAINLISPFCFYGTYKRKVFINNNGNISFGTSYSAFRADSFPNTNFVMIAPFWSDVDTRGPNSGVVYYQLTNSHLIVQWDSVGYFNAQDDKLNAFQLIITDGQDPLLPSGYNVGFCYRDMQWTTGNASQGVGGFGGIPATVGVNEGNGINYIQMGRFDQPGSLYDGPGGNPDGVSFLDNQAFFFNTCVSNFNIAPVVSSLSACDTVELCMGDSTDISVSFLGPEPGQQITPAVNLGNMQDISLTGLISGPIGSASIHVNGTVNNIGFHTIQVQGTDNGTPVQTTSTRVTIRVIGPPTAQFFATPDTGTVFLFDNYSLGSSSTFWDFGDGTSGYSLSDTAHFYTAPGVYTVTMVSFSDAGCFSDTVVQTITVLNNSVGLPDSTSLPPVQLVPNPSNGRIRILSRSMTSFDLLITDPAGRPVYAIDPVNSGDEMDLRSLSIGVYFYVLREKVSRAVRSGKLVIE